MQVKKVAIVGAGVVGTALASLLKEKGYTLIGLASRSEGSLQKAASVVGGEIRTTTVPQEITPEADLVFLTTSDSAIQKVCEDIAGAGGFHPGQIVVHTSGSLPSTILKAAKEKGALHILRI